ncbi:MAG: hypothetical protein AAF610_07975 [Pseudomonadota bacterium]
MKNKIAIIFLSVAALGVVAIGLAFRGEVLPGSETESPAKTAVTAPVEQPQAPPVAIVSTRVRDAVPGGSDEQTLPLPVQAPPVEAEEAPDVEPFQAHFHREYKVERVCHGKTAVVLPDGSTAMAEHCETIDLNPSPYKDDPTEQLLADIQAGQPWAADAMEIVAMRYFEAGYVQAGAGWLREHARLTGKVGLMHLAAFQHLSGDIEHELLRYEFSGILIARKYPVYSQKMLTNHRRALLAGGEVTAERLDAIDASVAKFVASLEASESGGAT